MLQFRIFINYCTEKEFIMKRSIVIATLFVAVVCTGLQAQKVKTKKRVEKQKGYLEEYYVLKEDKRYPPCKIHLSQYI